jgi:hypothetical protein
MRRDLSEIREAVAGVQKKIVETLALVALADSLAPGISRTKQDNRRPNAGTTWLSCYQGKVRHPGSDALR